MYLFDAWAIESGYRFFEGGSNMYVTFQINIKRNKYTSLIKPIKLPLSRYWEFYYKCDSGSSVWPWIVYCREIDSVYQTQTFFHPLRWPKSSDILVAATDMKFYFWPVSTMKAIQQGFNFDTPSLWARHREPINVGLSP